MTNAGTIPDRGLYAVTLPDGRRVGELDEEMVYEARPGQTFLLGASSWRIEEIGRDRVIVTPAPGVPGAVPFWRGDSVGRPKELGEAIGAFSRWAVDQDAATLVREHDLDELAAQNLLDYLREQQDATRVLPSDTTVVIERFRDEIGDWRLCVLTPFGGRVHAAWSLALSARIRDELDAHGARRRCYVRDMARSSRRNTRPGARSATRWSGWATSRRPRCCPRSRTRPATPSWPRLSPTTPTKLRKLGRKLRRGARRYGYEQFDECLESGIDAVYIALPNHLHRGVHGARGAGRACTCCARSRMALTEKDCQAMIRAARPRRA